MWNQMIVRLLTGVAVTFLGLTAVSPASAQEKKLRATFWRDAETVNFTQGVNSLAFSPDGKILASGNKDSTVVHWDVDKGKITATLTGHKFWVKSVAFAPDGKAVAAGGGDGTVVVWDVTTGK